MTYHTDGLLQLRLLYWMEEYMINMSEKLEQKALEDIGSTHKNAPDYNDAYGGSGVYVSPDEDDDIL